MLLDFRGILVDSASRWPARAGRLSARPTQPTRAIGLRAERPCRCSSTRTKSRPSHDRDDESLAEPEIFSGFHLDS